MVEEKKVDPYFDLIMNEELAKNEWPKDLDTHKAATGHVSLMAQTLDKELFDRLKDRKTSHGWTIARAINTGVLYPTSFVGCHAGDHESYKEFSDLFNPVIEKYHVGFNMETSKHVTDLDVSKITTDLSDDAKNKIISTRIRVARNLSKFPLNPAGTRESRLEIADLMEKVCNALTGDLAGTFYRHTSMTPEQTQQLIDDHFLFRGKDKMQAASGYH